jgi:glycosyltransferase involved in cell wall biosynthesis
MRLSEEKRPLLWIEVAEAVAAQHHDVHFLLVGDGVQRPLVAARIAASRFAARFHLGRLMNRTLYDSLLAMRHPVPVVGVSKARPTCPARGAGVRVPVVTMPAGGAVEAVDDGRTAGSCMTARRVGREAHRLSLDRASGELSSARSGGPGWVRDRFGLDRMIVETAAAYGGPATAHPRGVLT